MARLSGSPITLTPGSSAPVPLPVGGGYGILGVVLANLSTYLVQVQVGVDSFWLQPFTADLFALGSGKQPPIVTATQLAGDTQASGTIAPTWFSDGDLLDTAGYPAALISPAAIAAETAAAILQTGVPNVFLKTLVGAALNLGTGGHVDMPNLGNYATLLIQVNGGNVGPFVLRIDFDVQHSTFSSLDLLYSEFVSSEDQATTYTYTIPMEALSARITSLGATAVNFAAWGTNRAIQRPVSLGNAMLPRQFQRTGTWANGSPVALTANDGLPNFSNFSYTVEYYMTNFSTVAAMFLLMKYRAQDGTDNQLTVDSCPTLGNIHGTVTVPPGAVVQWLAQAQAADASSKQVIVTFMQES